MSLDITFRHAKKEDSALILYFIKALAEFENLLDMVVADEALLSEWIFEKGRAEVIFVVVDGKEVGFTLYFHNFSTFLGKSGIFLEDLFVLPEYRGKGYGKALLKRVAQITVENGYSRLEWTCLDWNKAAVDFYLSINAKPMEEWTVYRLAGDTLTNFSDK